MLIITFKQKILNHIFLVMTKQNKKTVSLNGILWFSPVLYSFVSINEFISAEYLSAFSRSPSFNFRPAKQYSVCRETLVCFLCSAGILSK